jgi:hypothetical protein
VGALAGNPLTNPVVLGIGALVLCVVMYIFIEVVAP